MLNPYSDVRPSQINSINNEIESIKGISAIPPLIINKQGGSFQIKYNRDDFDAVIVERIDNGSNASPRYEYYVQKVFPGGEMSLWMVDDTSPIIEKVYEYNDQSIQLGTVVRVFPFQNDFRFIAGITSQGDDYDGSSSGGSVRLKFVSHIELNDCTLNISTFDLIVPSCIRVQICN